MKLAFSSLVGFLTLSLLLVTTKPHGVSAELIEPVFKRSDIQSFASNDLIVENFIKRGPPHPPGPGGHGGHHHKRSLEEGENQTVKRSEYDLFGENLIKRDPHPPHHPPPHPPGRGGPGGGHHHRRSLEEDDDQAIELTKRKNDPSIGGFHGRPFKNLDFTDKKLTTSIMKKRDFEMENSEKSLGNLEKRDENEDFIDVSLQKRCGGGGMAPQAGPQKRDLDLVDTPFEKRCGGGGMAGPPQVPQKRDVSEDLTDLPLQKRCGGGVMAPQAGPQKRDLDLVDTPFEKRCGGGGMAGPPQGPQKRQVELQKDDLVLTKRGFGMPPGPPPGMPPFMGGGGGFHPPPFGMMGKFPMGPPPPGMNGPPPPGMAGPPGGGGDAGGGDGGDAAQKRDLTSKTEKDLMVKRDFQNELTSDGMLFEKRYKTRLGEKHAPSVGLFLRKRELDLEKRELVDNSFDSTFKKRFVLREGQKPPPNPGNFPMKTAMALKKRELEESLLEKRNQGDIFENGKNDEMTLKKGFDMHLGDPIPFMRASIGLKKREMDEKSLEKRNHGNVFQPGFVGR